MVGQLAVEDLASIQTRPICSVWYSMLFFCFIFCLEFFSKCLHIYQPINIVFFTFCIEYIFNFVFVFTFFIEFHFSKCFAMSPNLLSTYQICFLSLLAALSVISTLFSFFLTFCIECNFNFVFFTFCIEFHFSKCFAMSPNLLSIYHLCFLFYFLH